MTHAEKRKKKVAVISGGPSSEHEISVRSAQKVMEALDPELYEAVQVFIDKKGNWEIDPKKVANENDVAFIILHGTYGEDGTIQSILDAHRIPYTGSHAMQSALAMNKFAAGKIFQNAGLHVPLTFLVTDKEWTHAKKNVFDRIKNYLTYPFVVKPNQEGSSVGVHIVKTKGEFEHAMHEVFRFGNAALIQKMIRGIELTCGVLDHGWEGSEFPLMPTEIVPKSGTFFDYSAKYMPMGSDEITPARIPDYMIREVQHAALKAHRSIGAKGFSRTDFILTPENHLFVLEINTIPGLTNESLLPKAAEVSGISFSKLLDHIIEAAFRAHGKDI